MVEAVENLARTDVRLFLTWSAVVGWAAVGLTALGFSLRGQCRDRAAWIGTALLSLLFSVELAFPHRYSLSDRLRMVMKAVGGEEAIRGRRPIQAAVVVFVLVAAVVILAIFLTRRYRLATPTKLAVLGIGAGLSGLILETISLHQLDDYFIIYYLMFNAGMVISFVGLTWHLKMQAGAISAVATSAHARSSVAPAATRDGLDPVFRPSSEGRGRASSSGPGHATYRLGDIKAMPARRPADALGVVSFVLALACIFYVFGHAKVEGQESSKFVGGLGSVLLFAAVGAVVAGSPRRSLARVAAFGLAFGTLGITFNLALHPSNRPFWSADILQGMALSGLVVACWRRLTGGGPWAFAGLAALASSWWAFEASARAFPGSQYLYATDGVGLSLFPVLPWLTLSALGAVLVGASTTARAALALGLGLVAALGWGEASPFGPPVKFPLNATYASVGGSLTSAVFWLSGPARGWAPIREVSSWLGSRWLVFFYVHLGIATGLSRAGLSRPIACWAALLVLSIAATWLISEVTARVRAPFRHPATWAIVFASTLAVGLLPGVPTVAVLAVAGGLGLLFASRYDDLATLILGPVLADERPRTSPATERGGPPYLATLALVVAVLVAPELVARLPAPFGTGPRPKISSSSKPSSSTHPTP